MPGSTIIAVNTAGLEDMVERLRAASAASAETLQTALSESGEIVARAARARASFSTKIPGSIHTEVAGPGFVRVSTQLPEAVAIENRGKGHVRHPLFGTRTNWYTKNSPPAFLHPALLESVEEFKEAAVRAMHAALVEAGVTSE